MVRALEAAYDERLPVFYLIDSAGASSQCRLERLGTIRRQDE